MKKLTFEQKENIVGGSLTGRCFFVPFITLGTLTSTQFFQSNVAWNIACWKN